MLRTASPIAVVLVVAAAMAGLASRVWGDTAAATQVNILSWGDWGFDGPERQQVADSISNFVQKSPVPMDCALLLGDNFRVPLTGIRDPMIQKLFEQTYDPKVLNFPFYAALGNHDYEQDKALIELDYAKQNPASRWKMPAKWYRVDLPKGAATPIVTLLMLDSDKQALSAGDWNSEKAWIEEQLNTSRAPWTICAAHHTMFSNGAHGDNGVLQTEWGTLFKKYNVDFYLCGHDHTIQHLEISNWPVSFVVSGGGAAPTRPLLRDDRGPFFKSEHGFAHFKFTPELASVELLDARGQSVHSFQRTRAGVVTVVSTTDNDTKSKNPLRLIEGISDSSATTKPSAHPATHGGEGE